MFFINALFFRCLKPESEPPSSCPLYVAQSNRFKVFLWIEKYLKDIKEIDISEWLVINKTTWYLSAAAVVLMLIILVTGQRGTPAPEQEEQNEEASTSTAQEDSRRFWKPWKVSCRTKYRFASRRLRVRDRSSCTTSHTNKRARSCDSQQVSQIITRLDERSLTQSNQSSRRSSYSQEPPPHKQSSSESVYDLSNPEDIPSDVLDTLVCVSRQYCTHNHRSVVVVGNKVYVKKKPEESQKKKLVKKGTDDSQKQEYEIIPIYSENDVFINRNNVCSKLNPESDEIRDDSIEEYDSEGVAAHNYAQTDDLLLDYSNSDSSEEASDREDFVQTSTLEDLFFPDSDEEIQADLVKYSLDDMPNIPKEVLDVLFCFHRSTCNHDHNKVTIIGEEIFVRNMKQLTESGEITRQPQPDDSKVYDLRGHVPDDVRETLKCDDRLSCNHNHDSFVVFRNWVYVKENQENQESKSDLYSERNNTASQSEIPSQEILIHPWMYNEQRKEDDVAVRQSLSLVSGSGNTADTEDDGFGLEMIQIKQMYERSPEQDYYKTIAFAYDDKSESESEHINIQKEPNEENEESRSSIAAETTSKTEEICPSIVINSCSDTVETRPRLESVNCSQNDEDNVGVTFNEIDSSHHQIVFDDKILTKPLDNDREIDKTEVWEGSSIAVESSEQKTINEGNKKCSSKNETDPPKKKLVRPKSAKYRKLGKSQETQKTLMKDDKVSSDSSSVATTPDCQCMSSSSGDTHLTEQSPKVREPVCWADTFSPSGLPAQDQSDDTDTESLSDWQAPHVDHACPYCSMEAGTDEELLFDGPIGPPCASSSFHEQSRPCSAHEDMPRNSFNNYGNGTLCNTNGTLCNTHDSVIPRSEKLVKDDVNISGVQDKSYNSMSQSTASSEDSSNVSVSDMNIADFNKSLTFYGDVSWLELAASWVVKKAIDKVAHHKINPRDWASAFRARGSDSR